MQPDTVKLNLLPALTDLRHRKGVATDWILLHASRAIPNLISCQASMALSKEQILLAIIDLAHVPSGLIIIGDLIALGERIVYFGGCIQALYILGSDHWRRRLFACKSTPNCNILTVRYFNVFQRLNLIVRQALIFIGVVVDDCLLVARCVKLDVD